MSLQLFYSKPKVMAKAAFGGVGLVIEKDSSTTDISYYDFVQLTKYFLENEDLFPNDPRLELIEAIKKSKLVNGWEERKKRIELGPLPKRDKPEPLVSVLTPMTQRRFHHWLGLQKKKLGLRKKPPSPS